MGDYISEVMKKNDELRDALSVQVKLDHEEALKIVVNDLVSKLAAQMKRGDDPEAVKHFTFVVRWYVTEEELKWALEGNKF